MTSEHVPCKIEWATPPFFGPPPAPPTRRFVEWHPVGDHTAFIYRHHDNRYSYRLHMVNEIDEVERVVGPKHPVAESPAAALRQAERAARLGGVVTTGDGHGE